MLIVSPTFWCLSQSCCFCPLCCLCQFDTHRTGTFWCVYVHLAIHSSSFYMAKHLGTTIHSLWVPTETLWCICGHSIYTCMATNVRRVSILSYKYIGLNLWLPCFSFTTAINRCKNHNMMPFISTGKNSKKFSITNPNLTHVCVK